MGQVINYKKKGTVKCYLTGIERKETPEEMVRQSWLQRLVEEYSYPRDQIEVEYSIKMGNARVRVDIAIFYPNKPYNQENIMIIIEVKREDIKPTDKEEGIKQLESYLAACPNSKFGLWVGQEKQAYEVIEKDGLRRLEMISDIPLSGDLDLDKFSFDKLVQPIEGLRATFKRCHNYIYMNQGLQKEIAFREFLKVIFCKVYDEANSDPLSLKFYISNEERKSYEGREKAKKRLVNLFEKVKIKYSHIFNANEEITLDSRVTAYIIGELQRYSFLKADTDIKGEAYEEIVGSNLRGDKGEFFTPRNVCTLAVKLVLLTYEKSKWKDLKILDPACGTGGFLVTALNEIRSYILENNIKRFSSATEAEFATREDIKNICNQNFYGCDFNPFLVSACQMNMVMNGDGSSNIFHQNTLLPLDKFHPDSSKVIKENSFDIIITNPPFGNDPSKGTFIDDTEILSEFVITNNRVAVPAEQLFIERCIKLLKPGGTLAIVLPDNILSNPGLAFIRDWILKYCWIIAVIDLPTETFEPHTGVQTSVMVLRKKKTNDIELWEKGVRENYPIFMAISESIGHDRRGNKLYKRLPTGEEIIKEVEKTVKVRKDGMIIYEKYKVEEKIIDDDLPEIIDVYDKWLKENSRWCLKWGS